jgi:hypothetical protein
VPEPDDRRTRNAPLERLPARSSRAPISGVLAVAAALILVTWEPWAGAPGPRSASPVPSSIARAVATATPGTAALTGRAPEAPARLARRTPARSPGAATYVSLIDNAWTIVAMLGAGPVPTRAEADAGPFLVLQQGAHPTTRRLDGGNARRDVCSNAGTALDPPAPVLPARHVAYLGITFPGMDPRAIVSATGVGGSAAGLRRVQSPALALVGLTAGTRYRIPSTGPGGTVLFASTRPGRLAPGPYRFEVRSPGIDGTEYVYACIGT